MSGYQIGTDELRGVVGSRASRSNVLEEAMEEARVYSTHRHVRKSWLRANVAGSQLGPVLATFVRGEMA